MKKIKVFVPYIALGFFILFTVLLKYVDVKPVGPENTIVGFSTINSALNHFFGFHLFWSTFSDFMGIFSFFVAMRFFGAGIIQLIQRHSLLKVDIQLLILGGFYIVVIAVYFLFEKININYRPVILGKLLEVSYPSSHTMIVICILESAIIVLKTYIKSIKLLKIVEFIFRIVLLLTVLGRLISGVHWFTDILGGILISTALVVFFEQIINHYVSKKAE